MISVVVPVKNEWALTASLLRSLEGQPLDRLLILDNGSTDQTASQTRAWQRGGALRGKVHRTYRPDESIYQLWNRGFDWARRESGYSAPRWHQVTEFYVLVTNNDIVLPRTALAAMRDALLLSNQNWVSYPDYEAAWDTPWQVRQPSVLHTRETHGVLSSGGMFGACFMVAGHRIPWRPLVTDLTYEHWYGDDHLAEEIEQHGGRQVRVVGLPVKHVNEGTARNLDPGELWRMKYRDRQRWLTRYERT